MSKTTRERKKEVPKYPDIEVALGDLSGSDGNAFVILGRFSHALKGGNVPPDEIAAAMAEAKSGDYAHLLNTVNETVVATVTDFTVGKPLVEEINVIERFSAKVAELDEGVL